MPYVKTQWDTTTTPLNPPNMNNVEMQYEMLVEDIQNKNIPICLRVNPSDPKDGEIYITTK